MHLLILNERDIRHPSAGGAEVNLFQVGRRLVASGYEITLLCTHFPGALSEERIDGIRVLRTGNRLTYYLKLPGLVRREVTPDTVILEHLCKLPFCSPLYTRVPVLPIAHHLFGRTAFWQASFPVAAVVCAAEWLIPPVYRRCLFIAVSPSTRDDLIRRGVSANRVRVVPNGVDCDHYRAPNTEPGPPPTVLVLGRVEPYKRIDLVLRAFTSVRARIPAARLVVVGGGSGLTAVKTEVRRLGLEPHVICTGPVNEADKLRWIHSSHLVVNMSEKEGWGLTVLEAGACMVPTVASDVPGLRDAVMNEQTGVLVPYGDVDAVAAAVVDLLRDHERRRRLGVAARQWAERFSWDSVAAATAACIEEIAGRLPVSQRLTWFGEEGAGERVLPSAR